MIRERRKYIRLDTGIDFIYKLKGTKGNEEKSTTGNISPGGIRGLVNKQIKKGDWLELKISIPTIKKTIPAIGKVIWTGEETAGKINVGIKFEEIEPEMKNKFLEYVCDLMFAELEKLRP